MNQKFVYFVYPIKENNVVETLEVKIPKRESTIYDAVGYFEDNIFKRSRYNCYKRKAKQNIEISKLINLHDEDGLKLDKIKRLLESLKENNHLLEKSLMPNIKLIRTKKGEWVVFDGHHTLNSYMLINKKYLDEVPHLVVQNNYGYFDDETFLQFYGRHKYKLYDKDWRDYVINWNREINSQLMRRKRKNMFELNNIIKQKIRKKF